MFLNKKAMGWFSKKSEKQKLQEQYQKLIDQAYKLSHTDRKASDLLSAEAEEVLKKMEALPDAS